MNEEVSKIVCEVGAHFLCFFVEFTWNEPYLLSTDVDQGDSYIRKHMVNLE